MKDFDWFIFYALYVMQDSVLLPLIKIQFKCLAKYYKEFYKEEE